ncbi:hypothetical protein BJY01DRAFT_232841 [Aspergillus pseudoustus]|uniref:P-loop containing nucleoside triphosphate hydrolase protein n=1 Tax=Aspergillus pseudoustus TaxID=1810923 RepID=A0ABR4KH10_9EURO
MASQTRASRLTKFLSLVVSGKRLITTVDNFVLLVEAIQDQSDHAACVEHIIASPPARNAIHSGIRFNTTADFLNKYTSSLITYLTDPSVRALCNGQFLQVILDLIVEPCTVWNAFMQAFLDGQLTEPATQTFAWLLVELLTSTSTLQIEVVTHAKRVVDNGTLLQSANSEIRDYGQRIQHILQIRSSNTTAFTDLTHIPSGRHDNDQADFRQIAIYPTYDEFCFKEKPFYRRANEIMQLPVDARVAGHLDNQFRLLREDMLSGIRLSLVQVFYESGSRQYPCGLVFSCSKGLEHLTKLDQDARTAFLKGDRSYLRQNSFGYLLRVQEIVAFATINRQVDFLLSDPSEIVLRIIGEEALKKTLSYFKLYDDIRFVFVDAPVFAYEPVLRRLQDKVDFPLAEELLEHQQGVFTFVFLKLYLLTRYTGTGKTFHSKETILVMCYTNHALDQFLEDLLDISGVSSAIVRLGSKSSPRTAPLSLSAQQPVYSRSRTTWNIIDELKDKVNFVKETFNTAFSAYSEFRSTTSTLLEFLAFEEPEFFEAFTPPEQHDGMMLVGENGKIVNHYIQLWTQNLLDEHVTNVQILMTRLDEYQTKLETIWSGATRDIIRSKRIIGCTTTAAAMNAGHLRGISPGIVLLEEAGEILESHVLTAFGSETKQLIMIGDHKQLRPKIKNYALSVEKGSGYDLNRSLFERLVDSGYPHSTLAKQHCMMPEISYLVRNLTHPHFMDGDRTFNHPAVRGLQDRVIFIEHTHPENDFRGVSDQRDDGTKGSKRNVFEVQLVLKIIRYLSQQGYGTDKLVVLTPYLGQLHLLREELRKESDPVLNDLDPYDLVRASLISQASAQHLKRPFKLSTIDNYQGEESDIVIATLTRSNENGEIGFMSAPQRLNVLLSRARNPKGPRNLEAFFDQLQSNGHLYDVLPFKCEQHPERKAMLKEIEHFDQLCPDGGCAQACGTKLSCGLHGCPHKCHQLSNHSKMQYHKIMEWTCSQNHKSQQKAYVRELAQIQDEILHERRLQKNQRDEQERQRVLQQYRHDLNRLRASTDRSTQKNPSNKPNKPSSTPSQPDPRDSNTRSEPQDSSGGGILNALSSAEQNWNYRKDYEGAKSDELDEIMSKTTVARIYAKFLTSMGIIPRSHIEETTGSRLANGGVRGCEKQINLILEKGGGVLFIDEAYQLAQSSGMGSQRLPGKVVVILAGYRNQMEKFFAHNPELPSRFPHGFTYEDYNEGELRSILEYNIHKKFGGPVKVEGGIGGLYCRIIARRISRQRGHEGFGNARTVENNLSRILERQAKRLLRERRLKSSTNDFLLTKEDVSGPEPNKVLKDCSVWRKLREMIGLETVKDTVRALLDSIQANYERERLEEPLLYGQIQVDIGYLSNGEVVVKNPADFVRSVIGQSEHNTKGILASTVGKVLVIDEAYDLFGGGTRDKTGAQTNQFKTAVLTQSLQRYKVPSDDRCVVLLGYEEQMKEMFQNVNPGLSKRFPMDAAFLRQQGFKTSAQGRKVALEVLSRNRNSPHFGNAVETDNLLNGAKIRQQKRQSSAKKKSALSDLQPQDFDPDYDRGDRGNTNIPMLFQGIVGCETIFNQLKSYRQTVKNMRHLDMDPKEQVPFNFLFPGPPETGKTSTARKMGRVYYDMGLLSSAEVIESSATDLVGQYIGQTAYRLAEGQFAKEAMDEIVDCITKPKFFQKLIIILAGYDKDINQLMAINPGLTSRLPESLEFRRLRPVECINLLTNLLRAKKDKLFSRLDTFCITSLESPRPEFLRNVSKRFAILSQSANWANARDVQTIAKAIFGAAIQSMQKSVVVITEAFIIDRLDYMISERTNRASQSSVPSPVGDPRQAPAFDGQSTITTPTSTAAPSVKDTTATEDPELPVAETGPAGTPRDTGASDDVWNLLQQDLPAAETNESDYQSLLKDERDAQKAIEEIIKSITDDPKPDDEAKRQREQRCLEELARRARLEQLQRNREAEEAARRKEQKVQQKLRPPGYRCAGGSHYVSNGQLEV